MLTLTILDGSMTAAHQSFLAELREARYKINVHVLYMYAVMYSSGIRIYVNIMCGVLLECTCIIYIHHVVQCTSKDCNSQSAPE